MGIPKFFRWAGDRYRAIVSGIIGEEEDLPEIDNFYVDMNGIIHNCSHNNDGVLHEAMTTRSILAKVCEWIDHMVTEVVKPQKLMYLAVDGVAPRAKLNQQRARRFRAAIDRKAQLEQAKSEGVVVGRSFDSNCITPGTEFMVELGDGLRAFIAQKLLEDPAWKNLQVIFSGCEVPGEGEHKIIAYIRGEKAQHRFPPNMRHCIYGADADMILLALATHEPYTVIVREILEIDASHGRGKGSIVNRPPPPPVQVAAAASDEDSKKAQRKRLQFVRVHALRESLIADLGDMFEEGSFDGERFIDDFVFLTFLIGNDFLPHLPGIDIGDSAFDIIFDAYKTTFAAKHGYLITDGQIDYHRLEQIVHIIGVSESVVFQEKEIAAAAKTASNQQYRYSANGGKGHHNGRGGAPTHDRPHQDHGVTPIEDDHRHNRTRRPSNDRSRNNEADDNDNGEQHPSMSALKHMSGDEMRRLYYAKKFKLQLSHTDEHAAEGQLELALRPIIRDYLAGLNWCLQYYTQGCVSWSWFYPYHYGIFLQDMKHLPEIAATIHFELNQPLKPFQQLLACLPPYSADLLPPAYREIMTSPDSPMHSCYPLTFETDLNGKKNDYEAVVLLPFIDAQQLLDTEKALVYDKAHTSNKPLTPEDLRRNEFGVTYHFHPRPEDSSEAHLDLRIDEIPINIHPGTRFLPELIPGTSPTLEGFPDLWTILNTMKGGRTIYFLRGGGGDRGGRGGGRGGRGRYGGRGRGRGGGRGDKPFKGGVFEAPGTAFPMPGVTMVPSLSSYVDHKADATVTHVKASPEIVAAAAVSAPLGSPLVINLVLDENADHFLSAVTLQIQQQVADFTSFGNLPLGQLSYTTTPDSGSAGNTEYSKITSTIHTFSPHWFEVPGAIDRVTEVVQGASEQFGPIVLRLVPQAVAIPSGLPDGSHYVALSYEDISHLAEVEAYFDAHLHSGGAAAASAGAEHALLSPNTKFAFPRTVVVGEYRSADVDSFTHWLSNELAKFSAHFPPFYAHIIESYGFSVSAGEVIDLQIDFNGETSLSK